LLDSVGFGIILVYGCDDAPFTDGDFNSVQFGAI